MTAAAVDYLVLTINHRTNEDWYLELPIDIGDLSGAQVRCVLEAPGLDSIVLGTTLGDNVIKTHAESEVFEHRAGSYTGDILVTLASGLDIVTHIINLTLMRGITRRG